MSSPPHSVTFFRSESVRVPAMLRWRRLQSIPGYSSISGSIPFVIPGRWPIMQAPSLYFGPAALRGEISTVLVWRMSWSSAD